MPAEPLRAVARVDTHAELRRLTGDDPYVRWGVPDPLPAPALVVSGGVAVERRGRRRGYWVWPLAGAPDPAAAVRATVETLLEAGDLDRPDVAGLSIAQPHLHAVAGVVDLAEGGDWDWMWTTQVPAHELGEEDLVELSDTDDAQEITRMIAAHNPRAWAEPGSGRTELWLGLRDPAGELLVIGGLERLDTGVPHLGGILTATGLRGRGLGRLVSAALTRRALAGSPVCTLGMYSDNVAARAVYRRLGYRTAKAWSSRRLVRAGDG